MLREILLESIHDGPIGGTDSHVVDMNDDDDESVAGTVNIDTKISVQAGKVENEDEPSIGTSGSTRC